MLSLHPEMVTMPSMTAPDVTSVLGTDGRYHAQVVFTMAGDWQLVVHLTPTGGTPVTAIFTTSVYWS